MSTAKSTSTSKERKKPHHHYQMNQNQLTKHFIGKHIFFPLFITKTERAEKHSKDTILTSAVLFVWVLHKDIQKHSGRTTGRPPQLFHLNLTTFLIYISLEYLHTIMATCHFILASYTTEVKQRFVTNFVPSTYCPYSRAETHSSN